MRRAVAALFLLASFIVICCGLSHASLKLYVADEEVLLKRPLVMINGNIMIPIEVLQEHLGAEISWSEKDGTISVIFPDQDIIMQIDQESACVNNQKFVLEVAPQFEEDVLVVPLRFFADRRQLSLVFVPELMGLRLEGPGLSWEEPASPGWEVALDPATSDRGSMTVIETEKSDEDEEPTVPVQDFPAEPVIVDEPAEEQDLLEIVYMGGPRSRIFIDVKAYSGYQTNLLVNPDRLVIDLFGVSGEALPPVEVGGIIVERIRSSRFDDQTMRIVCDLSNSTGYRISPWPEGGVEIEFNCQLTDLGFEEENEDSLLWFKTSSRPTVEMIYLSNPVRLVLDLLDTTLIGSAFDFTVENERIRRIRVSQHLPSTTRVVLELLQPMSPLPIEERGGRYVLPLFPGTPEEVQVYLAGLAGTEEPIPDDEEEPVPDPEETPATAVEGLLSGLTVVVDPGHGGSDPGAIGHQGTFEKDVTLAIGILLGELLEQAGAEVVYTRDQDVYVSIFERPEIAVEANADLFISVHANSHLEKGIARGTETLYRANDEISQRLARSIQDELVKAITLIDRRIWSRDDLAVFNGCSIPAVLVEVGFLDHPEEEILLIAPGFQKVAAEGIYKGIERFLQEINN